MTALEGLDEIRWAELTDAFGPADDVPRLLRMLTGDADARKTAMDDLSNTIWHQGTTYEATPPAVPFLARLAIDDAALLPELLYLLGCIADGRTYSSSNPGRDPHSDAERAQATAWVVAAREAVRRELPALVDAVRADLRRAVIAGFCRVAYAFPEEGPMLVDALDEAFQSDDVTPLDQAAVVMALLRSGADTGWGSIVLLDVLVDALDGPGEPPGDGRPGLVGWLARRIGV
jgi:hypothetical protein